jgi:hypothetical protein
MEPESSFLSSEEYTSDPCCEVIILNVPQEMLFTVMGNLLNLRRNFFVYITYYPKKLRRRFNKLPINYNATGCTQPTLRLFTVFDLQESTIFIPFPEAQKRQDVKLKRTYMKHSHAFHSLKLGSL